MTSIKKRRSYTGTRRSGKQVPRYQKCNASFIMSVTNCPFQAFRETYLGIRTYNLPMTVLGTAVHGLFERTLRRDKRTNRYPYATTKKLTGAWWRFWSTAAFRPQTVQELKDAHGFEGYSTPWEDVAWASYPEDPERLRQSGCMYMAMFFKAFDPFRQQGIPIWVERQFQFWWEGIYWTGRVDAIIFEPDGAIIVDHKPSDYTEPVRLTGVQATFHQLAYELYYRRSAPGQVPLKAIWIYNYKSGKIQNVPLRDGHEFGMLVQIAHECQVHYGAVLHSIEPPLGYQPVFNLFHPDDIVRGDIAPRYPRGKHCDYCTHVEACQQWERNQLAPACTQYRLKLVTEADAKSPSQVRLPFSELPVVQRVQKAYTHLIEPKPIQTDLDL